VTLLAVQPYAKVQRDVSSVKQVQREEMREIRLYTDRIETKHHTFPIQDVLDMSYYALGNKGGLLYLHTIRGVYSYHVYQTPQAFIDSFKTHQDSL